MIERSPHSNASDSDFQSLVDLLRFRRQDAPDQTAYQFLVDGRIEGAQLTYRQLDDQSAAVASQLRKLGRQGDRALLLYPPGHEFLLAFFACLRAGIIAVPLPPPDAVRIKRALPRLTSVIRDANASLILTTSAIEKLLCSHFDEVDDFHDLSWINTESIVADEEQRTVNGNAWEPSGDGIAFLQYTSGSTSEPKGVMVSHRNVLHQCQALKAAAGYDDQSVTCTWMPYHHDYGLIEGLIQPLFVGVPCYFMSPIAFIKRPTRWLEAICKYGVTHSQAPNFAYDLCVDKVTPEQKSKLDLSGWRVAAVGAEPIRIQTLKSFYEAFKACGLRWQALTPAYGLAEATLVVSHAPPGEGPILFSADFGAYERGKLIEGNGKRTWSVTSCGRVLGNTQVEIVNPQTRTRCAAGEVGEIWVAGPSVAQGYWNRSDETDQCFRAHIADSNQGPFLRSGDLGCLSHGQLYVTGREKDLIIIRGLNHYPQDIEQTVQASHPAFRAGNGAAFSVEVHGEEELVVVYEIQGRRLRDLDTEAVLSAVREAVFDGHDLQVHAIALLKPGGVPKTTSGKIQRRTIKTAFLSGDLDAVAMWQASVGDAGSCADTEIRLDAAHKSVPAQTIHSVRQWISKWLADKNGVNATAINPATKFADSGVDSLRAADLASDLEQWLGVRVEPTIFWNFTTIDAVAAHFARHESDLLGDSRSAGEPTALAVGLPDASLETPLPAATASGSRFETESTSGVISATAQDSIAIIGMGCRFPGGISSPESYWRLLREGSDAISEIPRDRWNIDQYYDSDREAAGKMYARHGGFVQNVDCFDANFFGISPREAADLDPQQRLLLEVAWESLEHAGIAPGSLRGSESGVFVGLSSDDFATNQVQGNDLAQIDAYKTLGTARSFAAGRLAYLLGLHGPVLQLDTACSSSLVSVYQACQSLQTGECSLAIAGGVNLILSPASMIALCKLTALATDGRCKTFDAAADGYVRGEGCGMVVLKRTEDAIRDGDMILATIRSAAVNHDGASNGLTAPDGQAQQQLLRKALGKARLDGSQVAYVEAHGTGTELGDPIELSALDAVYGRGRSRDQPLYVGSMKTNIGHLEAAAGIAGMIKVVLMLQHRQIPPNLNFKTPNPHAAWDNMALQVPTELERWPACDPRGRAAVSSFGVSGTNAHVILEAADQAAVGGDLMPLSPTLSVTSTAPADPHAATLTPPLHLLPLSANSAESLAALAWKYVQHIVSHPNQSIDDICFAAATTRDHFKHRLAVIASSRDELVTKLRCFASAEDTSQVVHGTCQAGEEGSAQEVGFLFTGQGTQYVGMGRELYESQPVFRAAIDRCAGLLQNHLDLPLTDLLYGPTPSSTILLDRTIYTQPALFSLQYALVELWKSWGIKPTFVIGHSSGEYAAACNAGVISLEIGLELVAERGRLIDGLSQTGTMAVVMADEARVQTAIEPFAEQISIAAVNGPDIIVISGQREAVGAALASLCADGIDVEMLKTSNAGHSALIDPMLEQFRAVAESFQYAPPRIAMVSNVSGKLAGHEVACGEYWVQHLREPVRFFDGMRALAAVPCRRFVEIGPNPNLLAMGMGCLKGLRPRPQWLPSLAKERSSWETILYSLAELYAGGADIDWPGFHQPYARRRVPLPTYAFGKQSFPLRQLDQTRTAVTTKGTIRKSPLPSPQAVATKLDHLRVGLEDDSRELTERLDEAAIRFVIDALAQLGFAWHIGMKISDRQLHRQVPEQNRPKVTRVLGRLVERGLLEREDGLYRVKMAVPHRDAGAMLDALQRDTEYPECELMRRAGLSLASIWKGQVEPLSILFPDGNTDQAVDFYRHARLLAKYNTVAGEAIRSIVSQLPTGASLRVLEVGAGTGGLTTFLLPQLPAERSEYVFTDLSPLFLHAARERFSEYSFLQYQLLDIGKPAPEQGFATDSFDLVVAANVLHATPRLRDTLDHVQQLLKPGGWLMLLEGANPPLWGDTIFTLIDGWWNFEDKELRPDYPLMRRDRWVKLLEETRFDQVACLNDAKFMDDSQNTLYLAQTNTTARARHPFPEREPVPGQLAAINTVVHPITAASTTSGDGNDTRRVSRIDTFDQAQLLDLVRNHAARVMRLKPDDIELTLPLSEFGLDSLMATELRAQLGRTFGRELSLNTLQMRQSIEEIAAYVQEDQASEDAREQATSESEIPDLDVDAPRAHLVPLQPNGTKTPLFFIPAGYGDLFAFQQISHAIGVNQPVYGLQPASAKRVKTFRQMSIYRLVSAYISEIEKVQPQGPYYLSGYSAGGIIAVELARELMRQGKEIGLLVIFDPPSHVPFWLDSFYEANYRILSAMGLVGVVGRLRSKFARRLFHTVLDEGLRTHTSVTREHRVAPYPGRITHFRASLSQSSLVSMKPVGWFWRQTAQVGIEVHWIPGTHYGMLRGSGASVVVDELRDCLQRAKTSLQRR